MKNKSLEQKYLDLIEDGGNVSESSDVKEFFTVVGLVTAILFAIFFASDIVSKIYIDRMPVQTQLKLEKIIASNPYYRPDEKYEKQINRINRLKRSIIKLDKNLQGKSNFNIYVHPSKEINAFVTADGSIYFTEGLLNEINNDEELAFVLAHELGHYVHRDHLKFVSRQILAAMILSAVNMGQSSHFSSLAGSINNISNIKYSQKQETNADIYANHIILTMYGTNNGGIEFFTRIQKKENLPQFIHYISTHPSPQNRIKVLKTHK